MAANVNITRRGAVSALFALPLIAIAVVAFAGTATVPADYQSRQDFLRETLGNEEPQSDVIWMQAGLQEKAAEILGHPFGRLRVRYWYEGDRTAWVIDEIGKEKPITLGVVIEAGEIQSLRVLQFRESRGWEIRYPFFTRQFSGLRLNDTGSLNQRIDGITGATLSVRAATRSANLALVLDEHVRRRNHALSAAP